MPKQHALIKLIRGFKGKSLKRNQKRGGMPH